MGKMAGSTSSGVKIISDQLEGIANTTSSQVQQTVDGTLNAFSTNQAVFMTKLEVGQQAVNDGLEKVNGFFSKHSGG